MTTSSAAILLDHELHGPADGPVILVLGGISASRHLVPTADDPDAGWWPGVIGEGTALDPARHRLLGVEYRDAGRAEDGGPAGVVTTADQAAAIVELLDTLGIGQLDAVVGASYGGMVALALAEGWGERVRHAVVLCAAHESHPMSTALRAIQRRIVQLGLASGRSIDAMVLARALAMTTYRTAGELASRFHTVPGADGLFDVERYLLHAGERYARRTAPERFLALSLSADLHRVRPEAIDVPVTVIAAEGDTLVPATQTDELARRLPRLAAHLTLASRAGHDAFLVDAGRLSPILSSVLVRRHDPA